MLERLVRNLIVFIFHESGQSVRTYIDRVFQASEFLQYEASEQQLVERIVMNLHPNILKQAAFLDKPCTHKELTGVISLIEERMSMAAERRKMDSVGDRGNVSKNPSGNIRREVRSPGGRGVVKCWHCGRTGHVRSRCPGKDMAPGNV